MHEVHGKQVFDSLSEVVDPAHTALLIVDMQKDFLDPAGAYARNGDDVALTGAIVPVVVDLVRQAREAGVLVAFTLNTTLPDGLSDSPAWVYFKNHARPFLGGEYTLTGTWGHELVDELAAQPGDLQVLKHRSDAFVGTDLDNLLRANGVQTVVVAGIVTNGCVEATVRHAAFIDYYTVVAGDACASASQRLHDITLEFLSARHDVVTADQLKKIWSA
ncbi:isochorismatase family cysteine hydrolase [Nocardioides bigeumensis]|uniref:Cysteine hydrolase n=1 Tax=Nocardioides bigeumensis TaxID=433657 RepID=A0ABP5JZM2_9ACTN